MTAVFLRALRRSDQNRFLALARASRQLHQPWVHAPLTPAQFRSYLARLAQPGNFGFLVCRQDSRELTGVIEISNVVFGNFRSGYLGYYAFAGQQRQGLMRAGLQAVVQRAFATMKLHRLEANIQPGNRASIGLVKSCGFQREGYSPDYLKIGGRWRDHERWAIVAARRR